MYSEERLSDLLQCANGLENHHSFRLWRPSSLCSRLRETYPSSCLPKTCSRAGKPEHMYNRTSCLLLGHRVATATSETRPVEQSCTYTGYATAGADTACHFSRSSARGAHRLVPSGNSSLGTSRSCGNLTPAMAGVAGVFPRPGLFC